MSRWISLLFYFIIPVAFGQAPGDKRIFGEFGLPYMQHFEPSDYHARPDNHDILQGDNDIMFIGNSSGVLEFDGVNWRMIPLPNSGIARNLVKDGEGRIYVGGFNEVGYLAPDSLGFLHYVSLLSRLEEENHDFAYMRNSFVHRSDIYFQADNHLFRWSGDQFTVWRTGDRMHYANAINGVIYLQKENKGIFVLKNDEIQFLVDFQHRIREMIPLGPDRILVATQHHGLFVLENGGVSRFDTPLQDKLISSILIAATKLPNGWIALGSYAAGLFVINESGQLINHISKDDGLPDNFIRNMGLDNQGGLWLGLNQGISRIEVLSPVTIFDDRRGTTGFINQITRFQGKIYAAGVAGCAVLDQESDSVPPAFKILPGIGHSIDLLHFDDKLLIAADNGLFSFDGQTSKTILDRRAASLLRSGIDPQILYVGLFDGFSVLKKERERWTELTKVEGIVDDIRKIVELEDGKLWIESQIDGVWLVDFYSSGQLNVEAPTIKRFLANKELPSGWLFLHRFQNQAIFEIGGKVYRYNEDQDSIMVDEGFGELFGFNGEVVPKLEDEHGNFWMMGQYEAGSEEDKQRIVAFRQSDGSFEIKKIKDYRITTAAKKALYPEEPDVLWYGGTDGIVRQDLRLPFAGDKTYATLVRKITVNEDSMIFGGYPVDLHSPQLDFGQNSFRFEVAMPSYDEMARNEYQYFLEGFDKDWSAWTNETKKDYTQIPEGEYTFRVKGRNIHHGIGHEATFSLTVLPPWYRTWWSYGLYSAFFVVSLYFLNQRRMRRLIRDRDRLERMVRERTEVIRQQSNQLEAQTHKLEELNQAKSKFFANISHEFRTPLTLIKGPIENLDNIENLSMDNVRMIKRNTNRLLNLVNQLLDLSKLDEHSLPLEPTEGDVFKCLRVTASSFNSLAADRQIDFRVEIPHRVLWAFFDRDKYEKILYNLLSNAFKYSPDQAEINCQVMYAKGNLKIMVSDNGIGVPENQLPHIFERFYQVRSQDINQSGGSGIGLSLCKELVELMEGTIRAESAANKGATFLVELPVVEIKTGKEDSIEADDFQMPITCDKISSTGSNGLPRILLVEDNADMTSYIKEHLDTTYQVISAVDGEEGMKKVDRFEPELVITDLMMPKLNGVDLCRQLKEDIHTSHLPVIILTAKAGMENKLEGLGSGADDYLVKPFNPNELKARVGNLIEQRRRLKLKYSKIQGTIDPKSITVSSVDEKFMTEVLSMLETHYHDTEFGMEAMRDHLAMSKTQLHRKIKALTNESPGELLRNFRLKRAAQLLKQDADSVSQIAYSVGFGNLGYFTKCFKEFFGVLPSNYNPKMRS